MFHDYLVEQKHWAILKPLLEKEVINRFCSRGKGGGGWQEEFECETSEMCVDDLESKRATRRKVNIFTLIFSRGWKEGREISGV